MATRQELHLEILNQEYSRFVKDQVLTEVQLNEIIDFFEDQHRLTRTCLVGTGIVCGLHLYRSTTSVTLTPGVAVTTDGDLLRPPQSTYLYFTQYTPPDNCHYDPFYYRTGTTEKMLTLYRLLTEEEKNALNSQDFKPITELDATIKNWVGLLYLEYYTKDAAQCTPTNCDNLGIRQKATLKLLICSKEDMDKLIHLDADEPIGDDIYQKYHDAYDQYFTFPVLKAKRVRPGGANALKSTTLASAYYTAAKEGASDLIAAIKKLYKAFAFLIDHGGNVNINTLSKKLAKILAAATETLYAQYTYDFYKDVIAAYNELRETLYNVAFECCPNLYAFPKHVMLGAPNIEYGPQPPEYRHQFYPSPAVSKHKVYVNVAIGMLARLKLLVDNFEPQLVEEIRITPSLDYDQRLSERAIPFYYRNIGKIAAEWSYNKSLKGQEKLNLSYNADQYAKPIPEAALNPLDYDVDPFDFFRIEGHIGRSFQDALKELNEIRAAKGVPIDLVAVRLGDVKLSDIDLDDFACQFEDLDTILRAFQAEMNCLLAEGTAFFSGFTANAAEPHINLQLFKAPSEEQKWEISDELLKEIKVFNIAAGPAVEYTMAAGESIRKTAAEDISVRASRSAAALSRESLSDLLTGGKKVTIQTDICDQFNTPVFSAGRVVKTKINLNEQTFGKYFLQALEGDSDSVDTFVEKARNITNAANALKDLSEDDKYLVFEYPMQIIGNLNYIQRFIPGTLTGINTNLITSYRDFSQTFCKRLKAMHTRLETYFRKADYSKRGFETVYLSMLDNLGRLCCGNEKLEVIMEEIEARKKAILERLSFARYAEQHPGLEHKCGTHRGGTFVMVYAGKKTFSTLESSGVFATKENVLAAAELKKQALALTVSPYRDPDTFALYIAANDDIADKETELTNFLNFSGVREGSVAAESLIRDLNTKIVNIRQILCRDLSEPEEDVVIADFCLPYLCCAGCPPMAFVIPRERRLLALPTALACTTSEPILFSLYSPKGAIIDSPEAAKAIIQGENPAFDPAKVPLAQLGKTITFTLDGEATGCVIVVQKPFALVLAVVTATAAGDAFTVTYSNSTDEGQGGENSYAWSFNDGSSEVTTGNSQLVKSFSLKALAEKNITTITAIVTVLDDPCSSSGNVSVAVPSAEPDKTCEEIALGQIAAAQTTLTSEAFKKQLDVVDNSDDIHIFYERAVKFLDAGVQVITNNDQATRTKLIAELAVLLRNIYTFKVAATWPKEYFRVLEELLRTMLLLMLTLVRCDEKLLDEDRKAIDTTLSLFLDLRDQLKASYPQLDDQDILQKALAAYDAAFESQDALIKEKLKAMIEFLQSLT